MGELLSQKSKTIFNLILSNKDKIKKSIRYVLDENHVAEVWFKAMKHLRNVEPHPIDSSRHTPRDVVTCYKSFCDFAGIKPLEFDTVDREVLNLFHSQYMEHHDRLSRIKNCDIIYEFHQSIHTLERELTGADRVEDRMHKVSYSRKSTPFHDKIRCNLYYADQLVANNIYLHIAESGKKPMECWDDGESSDEANLDRVMVAHHNYKPDWYICLRSHVPTPLPKEFYKWFDPYKNTFLKKFGLEKWDHIDEQSSVLLATIDDTQDVASLISKGFIYHRLEFNS